MTSSTTEIKNVLIVGLGYAGASAVQSLRDKLPATHRLVAMHESSFGYNPIGCLRAATVPGWEKQVTAPLNGLFPAGTRHLLLANHRAVKLNANSVILEELEPDAGKQIELEFEARLIIIGGGPAGVEAAGEVASQYPDKTVTLVHSHSFLFESGWSPKFGPCLASQLEALGVDIRYNCRPQLGDLVTGPIKEQEFNFSDGSTVNADFIYITFGCKPNSHLVGTLNPSLLDAKGFVLVKPTLQLEGFAHIFVVGDVTAIPENKLAGAAARHAWAASSNCLSLIRGKATGLKEYSAAGQHASISVGPDGGAAEFMGFVVGPWLVARFFSKGLGRRQFGWCYNTKV
ncbi:hypothetical protein RQP46_005277 [Phenoliferia psychrophenolica]